MVPPPPWAAAMAFPFRSDCRARGAFNFVTGGSQGSLSFRGAAGEREGQGSNASPAQCVGEIETSSIK